MNLIEYTNKQTMMIAVADMVAANIEAALDVRNKASIAVPGGTTPGPMFDELCQAKLNWKDVSVMLTDERWLAEDHPRSNTMLVKNRLMCNQSVGISYVGLYNGDNSPQLGATTVSQDVEAQLPLDVVVLGMGEDMHTASLFPGAAELPMAQATDAPAVVAITPGGDLEARVTLSARAISSALCTHVLIIGDAKKAAVMAATRLSAAQAPISQFLANATVHWAPE